MAKSEETRRLVADTALRLFRERGYEATTMRLVAGEAGVATGAAYYYFPSKDALVQELYRRVQVEHREAVADRLPLGGTFEQRLRGVLHAGLGVMAPFRSFGATFVSTAIRPGDAASPFSEASTESRDLAVGLFADVVAGSDPPVRTPVADELPVLLWLLWLGTTLFWLYDDSPGAARTHRLVDGVCPLVARLVRLSRLPVLRGTVADVLALLREARV